MIYDMIIYDTSSSYDIISYVNTTTHYHNLKYDTMRYNAYMLFFLKYMCYYILTLGSSIYFLVSPYGARSRQGE